MTDPVTNEPPVKEDDQFNFNWWITMLPFLAAVCWFIYQWSQNRSNLTPLMYAGGSLLIGLVVGAMVSASSTNSDTTSGGSNDQ